MCVRAHACTCAQAPYNGPMKARGQLTIKVNSLPPPTTWLLAIRL